MPWRNKLKKQVKEVPYRGSLRILNSPRLTLVAASSDLVQADLKGSSTLAGMLNVHVPDNWPPELYDREPMNYALRQLADPAEQGWSFWYLLSRAEEPNSVMGICAFKGRPDGHGSVEIGYSILSQYRNQGIASEAVARLLTWAFSHQSVVEVCAETLPHLQPSIRVMKKNGFSLTGAGSELGVVRYAVKRPDRM